MYAEAMREFWSEWVVNYDASHQIALGDSAISRSRNQYQAIRDWFTRAYERLLGQTRQLQHQFKQAPGRVLLRVIAVIAFLFLIFRFPAILRGMRGLILRRRPGTAPRASASLWYVRLLRMLARRGYEKLPVQTPQEHLATMADEHLRASVERFITRYESARFGDSPEDAERLSEAYDEVETALASKE
jgi:hypothetical protein